MKLAKLSIVALVLVSGAAFAQDAGGGDGVSPLATAQTATFEPQAEGAGFVVSEFDYNVSANVGLSYDESTSAIGVLTWNTRGRNHFAGSSEGGSVAACGDPTTGSEGPEGDASFDNTGCTEGGEGGGA